MYVPQIGRKEPIFSSKVEKLKGGSDNADDHSVPFGVDMPVIKRRIYHLFFQTV